MRPHRAIGFFLGVTAWVATIPVAIASPSFPAVVQQTLHLPEAPNCSLCHGLGQWGYRTVTTTFGATMLEYGAIAEDTASIQAALLNLQSQQPPSPLILDLIAGRDPNREGGDPHYGCGSSAAPAEPILPLALALAALGFQRWRLAQRRLKRR